MIKKLINNIILVFIFILFTYRFQGEIESAFSILQKKYLPCQTPIYYALGAYDERFGISKDEFLSVLKQAENIWEDSYQKNLFEFKEDAKLKINLVYDSRQHTTLALKDVNNNIEVRQSLYNLEKEKYYKKKSEYEDMKSDFTTNMNSYTREDFEFKQSILNQTVLALNTMAGNLNNLANSLNLEVSRYNEIGKTHVEEFEEAIYHTGPDGEWIDIYQFENKTKLKRVLAHELGHALGLDHVEDGESIMFHLNDSNNIKATNTDLIELQRVCKLES